MYSARLSSVKARFYFNLFALCRGVVVQFDSYRSGYPARIRNRIAAIPNAVSTPARFAQPALETPRAVLLAVGRFTDEKRFDVLIDAFHLLAGRHPGWDLRVVGDGVNRGALETRVRELKLEGRATICFAVADVEAEYAGAQLFVLPSRWEGFPNALAEAMVHGLPAVGFASCPGVNELIVPGANGWLAPAATDATLVTTLAETLAIAMGNPEARRTMGERAKASMGAYAPQSVYDRWEAVLEAWARPWAAASRRVVARPRQTDHEHEGH
jgi:glycosyltransferase involved in cell wall biosynthesis